MIVIACIVVFFGFVLDMWVAEFTAAILLPIRTHDRQKKIDFLID